MTQRGVLIILAAVAHLGIHSTAFSFDDGAASGDCRIELFGSEFDLSGKEHVVQLRAHTQLLISESIEKTADWELAKSALLQEGELSSLSTEELWRFYHPPKDTLTKKERRGLRAIHERLGSLVDGDEGSQQWRKIKTEIDELASAILNNRRNPLPRTGMSSVVMVLDQLQNTVGNGDRSPANVLVCGHKGSCACAPGNSTFWTQPKSIDAQNLYRGFGRDHLPDWSGVVWEYQGPKTSRGTNPGFEIRCGSNKAKIKFAEKRSEPFNTRVFHALGYNVDATDYVPFIRMKYDRRLFLEFNLRRELLLVIRFFGLFTMANVNMQGHQDPFEIIDRVELVNGEELNGEEFKQRLLSNTSLPPSEMRPEMFNRQFEDQVAFLVTRSANFQIDEQDGKSVGPWGFDELGHEDRREVRGAALLAAWLGWFDTRFDNTRLRLADDQLRHYFSDLGGGLGKTDAAFGWSSENINEFPWTFTEAAVVRGKGRMTTPFKVVNYHTILDNKAFKAMTTEDARWMAGLIAQLSREQIIDALVASGHDTAETMLYAEKLIHRRNKMVRDLGLEREFGLLRRKFATIDFDYDPVIDGFSSETAKREFFVEEPMDRVVRLGELMPRESR